MPSDRLPSINSHRAPPSPKIRTTQARQRRAWLRCALLTLACAPACASGVRVEYDISYDDRDDDTRLDVYLPTPASSPHAGVLLVHGGGWHQFDRTVLAAHAQRFAELGYVAINVEYRLVPEGVYPQAPQDVICALAFARTHAAAWQLDPQRIAAFGYSAGGHLVSLAGVASEYPRHANDCPWGATAPPAAVISGAGPQDLRTMSDAAAVINFVGGTLAEVPQNYSDASPITHVKPGAPPFLFVHSDGDLYVPYAQTTAMRAALNQAGNHTELLRLPGGGHIANSPDTTRWDYVISATDLPEAWLAMDDFLARHLAAP